jgi:hypothetical protein
VTGGEVVARLFVREPLGIRVGTANDDFTRNLLRFVCEERMVLAVERPTAVCSITGLPTGPNLGPTGERSPPTYKAGPPLSRVVCAPLDRG